MIRTGINYELVLELRISEGTPPTALDGGGAGAVVGSRLRPAVRCEGCGVVDNSHARYFSRSLTAVFTFKEAPSPGHSR